MITAQIQKPNETLPTDGSVTYDFNDGTTPTVGGVTYNASIYGGDRSKFLSVNGVSTATINVEADSIGFWWSAIDKGNSITFIHNGVVVGYFDYNWVTGQLNQQYMGNPVFGWRNPSEHYAYINFYGRFDSVIFQNSIASTNFEIDNLRIGHIPEIGVPMISMIGLMLLLRRRIRRTK